MSTGVPADGHLEQLGARWMTLMQAGDYAAAWEVSDAVLEAHAGIDCSGWPRHEQFIWDGSPVEDRRVLVRCYHGLGDTLQMARFLPRLGGLARHLTVWAQAPLLPLLATLPGIDRLLPLHDGDPGVAADVELEIMELPHFFRVTRDELRHTAPYLHVPGASAPRSRGLRQVGIVWASGDWDPRRSIAWRQLLPLASIPGTQWHILQRGPALGQWDGAFGAVPSIDGFAEEARALRGLDLLVSVDTCSAHLAGALGVPVWLLLPAECDWRWMQGRSDSPWYPGMRLVGQDVPGDWDAVVQRVARSLRRGRLA